MIALKLFHKLLDVPSYGFFDVHFPVGDIH